MGEYPFPFLNFVFLLDVILYSLGKSVKLKGANLMPPYGWRDLYYFFLGE